ncbi:MAG: hypothetical protein KAT40_07060 [Bacteroidales bacterium]|nr:hypothetical protein [Bacteroidales bacterium]
MRKLIFILFAISIAFSSCKFVKEKGWFGLKNADTMDAYLRKQESIHIADSISKVIAKQKAIEQARQDSINNAEQERLERLSRFKYHIVVGSFITPQYADEWSIYYNSIGYGTEILKADNEFNLVSARKYDNMKDALIDLEHFMDTVQIDAWVYINE